MKKILTTTLIILGVLLLVGYSAYRYGKKQAETKIEWREVEVIKKQIDTLYIQLPPIKEEIIVYKDRWKTLKEKEIEIVYDEEECGEIVHNLKQQIESCDTIVRLQEEVIHIKGQIIHNQELIIDKLVLPKRKPWGVGLLMGYGTDGKKLQPYIGVGVSYDIISF